MDCRDVDRLMDAWLDRELDATAAGELEAHLHACERCGREWAGLVVLLTDPEPVEVPAGLRDRIVASLDGVRIDCAEGIPGAASRQSILTPWRNRFLRLRYAGAIAACILFFMTGWFMSGWWTGSKPNEQLIAPTPEPRPVTVVVSPWVLSSMAQAAAMPAPISPAVMLVGGVIPEMIIPEARADEPMIRVYQRRTDDAATQPADAEPDTDLKLLPLVPRYLGA